MKKYYKKYLKPMLGGNGPNKRKPDTNGYYLSTVGKGSTKTRPRTIAEIYATRKWAFDKKHNYTFHPCYENLNDKESLRWFMSINPKEEVISKCSGQECLPEEEGIEVRNPYN